MFVVTHRVGIWFLTWCHIFTITSTLSASVTGVFLGYVSNNLGIQLYFICWCGEQVFFPLQAFLKRGKKNTIIRFLHHLHGFKVMNLCYCFLQWKKKEISLRKYLAPHNMSLVLFKKYSWLINTLLWNSKQCCKIFGEISKYHKLPLNYQKTWPTSINWVYVL